MNETLKREQKIRRCIGMMLNVGKEREKNSQIDFASLFYHKVLPLAFIIFGVALLFLIITPILNLGNGLQIGSFFFQSFHLASLYLPVYFITIGLLVYHGQMTYRFLRLLNWSFIPFLTLALALKTAFATQPSALEQSLLHFFPAPGATVITLAIFAVELVGLGKMWVNSPSENIEDSFIKEEDLAEEVAELTEEVDPQMAEKLSTQLKQHLDDIEDKVPLMHGGKKLKMDVEAANVVDEALAELDEKMSPGENAKKKAATPKVKNNDVIQQQFARKKELMEEAPSPFVRHPVLDEDGYIPPTNQAVYDESMQDLPPHLQYKPLLTDEEQEALSQMADMIAENSEEERRMAAMLQSATHELDHVLSNHQMGQPPHRPNYDDYYTSEYDHSPAVSQPISKKKLPENTGMHGQNTHPMYHNSVRDQAMLPQNYSPQNYRVHTHRKIEEQRPDYSNYEPGNAEELHREPFTSLFNDLVEADGVCSYANAHVKHMFDPYRDLSNYHLPVGSLLTDYKTSTYWEIDEETNRAAAILEETLKEFNIEAQVTGIQKGPVITMFELLPAPGVKLSRIEALADNIAFRLAASRVRIVAPIPDKQAVGIEVPNKERSLVSFKEMVQDTPMHERSDQLPIVLGKDIGGNPQIVDLTKMPHLLIAGSTGSGKSVCVNGIICSFLFARSPRDVRMILIDPKVVELKPYNEVPHLLTPVITEPAKALQAMQWAVGEMERRYSLLDSIGVRNIKSYNKKVAEMDLAAERLSYLVIVIDEFADLMASCGKELEGLIARLAAKSRAAGIHLIIATQRPSVDVITGLIKANFPCRIAFMVAGKTDSRIILDAGGAEQLLGKGDMLFISSWHPFPVRIQGAYLSEEEVENVASFVKSLAKPHYIDDEIFRDEVDEYGDLDDEYSDDPLFDKAVDIVMETGKATASYLQRRLKVGYNRAARLIDIMENRGIVGPSNGSRPREILQQH